MILRSDDVRPMRRLYPIELVDAIHEIALQQNFSKRRPSGCHLRQQAARYDAWNTVMASIMHKSNSISPATVDMHST